MEYADVLWDGCTESESDLLGHVQYEAAKIVTGAMKGVEGLTVINGPKCNKLSSCQLEKKSRISPALK